MAIVLRSTKGSALTHAELDNNFTELSNSSGETGTWTPTIGNPFIGTWTGIGEYVKVGDMVTVNAYFNALYMPNGFFQSGWAMDFSVSALPFSINYNNRNEWYVPIVGPGFYYSSTSVEPAQLVVYLHPTSNTSGRIKRVYYNTITDQFSSLTQYQVARLHISWMYKTSD